MCVATSGKAHEMRVMESLVRAQLAIRDRFISDERGASAVEYALLIAGIAIAIIAAIQVLGGGISNLFTQAANEVTAP